MASPALTAFLISLSVFIVLLGLFRQEQRRGRRLVAARARAALDRSVESVTARITKSVTHFVRYIVQLSWYYSIHSVLRTLLRGIVTAYEYLESIFERNRERAKQLRAEKRQLAELNHLRQMAAHRADTALTPKEQQKLLDKTLAGDN